MNFLKKLFGSKTKSQGQYIRITLNDKMMPMDRGFVYEDPLNDVLMTYKLGEVTGGGTLQLKSGEIGYCDLEVFINSENIDNVTLGILKDNIEKLGAPKGSKIVIEKTNKEVEVGKLEGIGIYLDGVNLPDKIYKENDINVVVEELQKLLNDKSETLRYWEGDEEVGLYFYGESFEHMKEMISDFVNEHPLCQNVRIEQIA